MRNLIVRLSDKQNYSKTFDLEFDLIQSNFLPTWIDRFLHAQQRQDVVSEPWAMYNLNDQWTSEYTLVISIKPYTVVKGITRVQK